MIESKRHFFGRQKDARKVENLSRKLKRKHGVNRRQVRAQLLETLIEQQSREMRYADRAI